MLALIIAIICTTSFSLIIRASQRSGQDQFAVMGLNYAAASLAALAFAGGHTHVSPPTLHIGLIAGTVFVITYFFLIHGMDLKGVAVANAITRLSVLIPVLATVLIFGEKPHLFEAMGGALALMAMPFLSLDRGQGGTHLTPRQVWFLLGLFVTNGSCLLTSKWFHTTGLSAERPIYFAILFGAAAIVSLVAWTGWSRRCTWQEVGTGIPLGVINLVTSYAVLMALDTLSGTIVFPVFAAMGLALTTGVAAWLWRETPGRLGQVGIAIALVAVVLINM
ncbi:MAG: DMT family transporter [Armatimonadia bacterium]